VDEYVKEKVLMEVEGCHFRDDSMKDENKKPGIVIVSTHRIIFWDSESGFEIPLEVLDQEIQFGKFYQSGH